MTQEPRDHLSIAVLLPCYNEEQTIADVVLGFRDAMPEARIYVYDNNSSDLTALKARASGAIVVREPRQGKGNVVRRMFSDIDADVYVMADGDGTYKPEDAPQLVNTLLTERADMVVGTRAGVTRDAGRAGHAFGNQIFNTLYHQLFGRDFTDIFSGYRAFTRRFVKSFPAVSDGFEIETEMSVHASALKLPVCEIALDYGRRPEGIGVQTLHLSGRCEDPADVRHAAEGNTAVPVFRDHRDRAADRKPCLDGAGAGRIFRHRPGPPDADLDIVRRTAAAVDAEPGDRHDPGFARPGAGGEQAHALPVDRPGAGPARTRGADQWPEAAGKTQAGDPRRMRRIGAFLCVGTAGFLVDAGILAALLFLTALDPFSARLVSIGSALFTTWILNRLVTFGASGRPLAAEGALYGGVGISTSLVNYALYALVLLAVPAMPPLAALVTASIGATVFSYLGYSRLVFNRRT